MRKVFMIIVSVLISCFPGSGRKMPKAKASNAGTQYIESAFAVYDGMQKKIHSLAELGYMEAVLFFHLISRKTDSCLRGEWPGFQRHLSQPSVPEAQ